MCRAWSDVRSWSPGVRSWSGPGVRSRPGLRPGPVLESGPGVQGSVTTDQRQRCVWAVRLQALRVAPLSKSRCAALTARPQTLAPARRSPRQSRTRTRVHTQHARVAQGALAHTASPSSPPCLYLQSAQSAAAARATPPAASERRSDGGHCVRTGDITAVLWWCAAPYQQQRQRQQPPRISSRSSCHRTGDIAAELCTQN
jgi:hypothetical protein